MLALTSPKEYLKRKRLLLTLKKKYDVGIISYPVGEAGYQTAEHNDKEALCININDPFFYEYLLHELGHLLDFRLRNAQYGDTYQKGHAGGRRIKVDMVGNFGYRGRWHHVIKEELIASKTAIRLGKSLGIEINKDRLLAAFRTYLASSVRGSSYYNKTQIANIDVLATKYLK